MQVFFSLIITRDLLNSSGQNLLLDFAPFSNAKRGQIKERIEKCRWSGFCEKQLLVTRNELGRCANCQLPIFIFFDRFFERLMFCKTCEFSSGENRLQKKVFV